LRVLSILRRRTYNQPVEVSFEDSPCRRITELKEAKLKIVELLKPDWSAIRGQIRFPQDVPEYIFNPSSFIERPSASLIYLHIKWWFRYKAFKLIQEKNAFTIVSFNVIDVLLKADRPQNRRERRALDRARGDWVSEIAPQTK